MSSMRASLIAVALLFGAPLNAAAADLYGGMKDAPVYAQPTSRGGWYARIDGAWAAYNIGDVSIVDLGLVNAPSDFYNNGGDVDNGWSIGGGVGRYFGGGFRGDLTLEHRTSTKATGTAESCCDLGTETDVDGLVGLANVYYDFNRGGRITPYIGAGLGFARLETDGGTLGCVTGCGVNFGDAEYEGSSNTNLAVAAMAGLSVKLRGGEQTYMGGIKDAPVMVDSGRGLYLDVGYRFLHLGDVEAGHAVQSNGNELEVGWDDLNAHEVRFGLRYDLN